MRKKLKEIDVLLKCKEDILIVYAGKNDLRKHVKSLKPFKKTLKKRNEISLSHFQFLSHVTEM